MAKRLNAEDGRTLDLLLDGAAKTGGNGNGGQPLSHHGIASKDRVAATQSFLKLLDVLPAEDPPADLLERTMRHIDRASGIREVNVSLNPSTFSTSARPHA